MRFLAREYYENGKMGHTRKRLLERVAERYDVLEAKLAKYKRALEIACKVNPDSFRTSNEAMKYCLAQADQEGQIDES